MGKYKQSFPLCNFNADRIPTYSDDSSCGFSTGSLWGYLGIIFRCEDATTNNAIWVNVDSGGGVSTFSALTDSPYDNTLLAEALDSKQDKPNGVLTGCTITLGSFPLGKNVRITEGTWRISPREYGNVGSGDTDFLVALSASGLQRYVEIVGTNVNTIIKVEGAENAIAVRPTLGVGQTSLGSILVKDALIDPPVPDLSGYVHVNGSDIMSGYFQTVELGGIRSGFEMQYSGLNLYANGTSSKTYTSYVSDRFNVYTDDYSVPANSRAFKQQKGVAYEIYQDILKITGLTHIEIAAKINAEPYGLITKQYASDNYGNVIQKEFTLDFDATEDTFEKTHNYYNDYITYSIRKADGSYYKETEYDVRSTTTTFTVAFVTPPAAGTGKLTLQSVQKEAPSGGGGIGTGIIGSTFIVG